MHSLDWLVLGLFLAYTLWDGLRHQHSTKDLTGLLLAGRQMPWWAMGLSVMATQASAITLIGTTGQAFTHDMRFIQVYLGLPLAVVVLCVTLVPFYHRLKVFTIYETLESRFGLRTRLVTSGLFLLSRGASLGVTIAAPAYVLALILQLPFSATILVIGLFATFYTMFGGITGVIRTDVKQMILMIIGLGICFVWVWYRLPNGVEIGDALQLAGLSGKLRSIDLSFDPSEKYNIWSGLLAGFFLMLSYFGADQSQVQRYLTAKSLSDARISLLLSGIVKIPLQFLILLFGALLYVHYVFAASPLLFMPGNEQSVAQCSNVEQSQTLWENRRMAAFELSQEAENPAAKAAYQASDQSYASCRKREMKRQKTEGGELRNDTNYVFPYFVLHELPKGLAGLLVAAILAAALSSIDSMLNSLSASTIVDWWQRLSPKTRSNNYYLWATRLTTLAWGIFATLTAIAFGETESIIELVNQIGSYFYGPILGIFLMLWMPRISGNTALWALSLGMITVLGLGAWHESCIGSAPAFFFPIGAIPDGFRPVISYLWLNPIGTFVVLLVGWLGKNPR